MQLKCFRRLDAVSYLISLGQKVAENQGCRESGLFVKRISIENAKEGQVLAQKLQRADGVLLAGQGTEVTEGLLRMLARMNVDTIVIEDDNTLSPEELEDIYQKKVAELEARFIRVAGNPISESLKNALIEHARNIRDEALAAIIPPAEEEGGDKGEAK